jgi:hypothetical protein
MHEVSKVGVLIILLIVLSLSGCVDMGPFAPQPTVVPTITLTPTPLTTTAPPTIPPIKSLATGTQIVWKLQGGYGQLVIKNGLKGADAVVILAAVDDPKNALLAVYVKGGQDCTVDGISDGQYVLFDMIGTNWDEKSRAFAHTSEYARFERTLNYYTTATESKVYTVTLNRSGEGDTQSAPVNRSDMPGLSTG